MRKQSKLLQTITINPSLDKGEILIDRDTHQKKGMEIPIWTPSKIQKELVWRFETGLKILSLEKGEKDKVVISRLLQILTGALDKKYESCCELTVINIISVSYKKILVPNIFSSTGDKSWPLKII
jgi:hypothetical protein